MNSYKNIFSLLLSTLIIISCMGEAELNSPDLENLILDGEKDSLIANLNYDQEITIGGELKIKFEDVVSDSRCPIDAICVWAGNGEVKLILSTSNKTEYKTINTYLEPREIIFQEYKIKLKTLNPAPRTDREIKKEDYNIDLIILLANQFEKNKKPVQLIADSNTNVIKRDMLNINRVALEKDFLSFEVSYSGGCKEHLIELFAFKEIQKSNPAQVTLILSHDAKEDECLAYITQKIIFDLTRLKEFLKNTYNIRDKVLLVIHDPSGRPIRNPIYEYNF